MDSANALFVCGAECGIAAAGTLSAGVEHWTTVSGTPTVVTSGPSPMRSTRCFRFNPTAAAGGLAHTFFSGPSSLVARFYVYFASLPTSTVSLLTHPSFTSCGVWFNSTDSKIYARNTSGVAGASGVSVTTGQWYRIDFKSVTSSTVDVSVDGVACGQAASGPGSWATFRIGSAVNYTADFYIDDLIVSGVSTDYPIGASTIVGLYPVSDRTSSVAYPSANVTEHFYDTTTTFGKGAGGATALAAQNSESTSWQSFQNPLSTTVGSFVAAKTPSVGMHMNWNLDDLPSDATSVNGAMGVLTTHSAAATANSAAVSIGSTAPWNGDLSETTITVPVAVSTASETVATINAARVNFTTFTDVNPDPYLDGACLEVDYVAAPAVEVNMMATKARRR